MSERKEVLENELEVVNGGRITYTWDGHSGSIGKDGNNIYKLVDKDAFVEYYNTEGRGKKDSVVLRYLLEHGIAQVR